MLKLAYPGMVLFLTVTAPAWGQQVILPNQAPLASANLAERGAMQDRADARTDRSIARYDSQTGHPAAAANARAVAREETGGARADQRAANRDVHRAYPGDGATIVP